MPWNVVPATASPSPTIIADSTRGRRRSTTIVSAAGVQVVPRSRPNRRWARIATVSAGATDTLPSPTPRIRTTTRATMPRRRAGPPAGNERRSSQPAWASDVPSASLRVAMPVSRSRRPTAKRPGDSAGTALGNAEASSGWMATARATRPSARRGPGPGDDHVVGRSDRAGLDRGHRAPAGSLGDDLGRRPVGGVTEDDDLRIGGHELLERDVRRAGRGGDRRPAGERDHALEERVLLGPVDLLRRVDLVERPRRGQALGGRGDLVEAGPHRRSEVAGRRAVAGRVADELDVVEDALDVRGIDRQHRDVRPAELVDRGLRGQAVPVGDDEVGAEGDDLLDVDALVGRHDRQIVGGRRVVGDVLDLADGPVAGADREQDLGGGRRERHDLLRLGWAGRRRSLWSSVRVSGNVAAGTGRRARLGRRRGAPEMVDAVAAGGIDTGRGGRRAGAGGEDEPDDDAEDRQAPVGRGSEAAGPAGRARPLAEIRSRGRRRGHVDAYPFSRRFEHDPWAGDRTRAVGPGGCALDAATTVAGLCRDLTGFATQRSGVMRLTRRLYHRSTAGGSGRRRLSGPIRSR